MLVAAVSILAGFAEGGSTADGRTGTTLSVYGFDAGTRNEVARAKLAASALRPARVSNPVGGFNADAFLSGVAAGHVPDAIYLDRRTVAALAAKGAIRPLTSCVQRERIDLKQYRQAALAEATYKRRLYALPEFTNEITLIVNDAAVRDAGLKPSDIQTADWPALLATAKRLTKRSGAGIDRVGFDPRPDVFLALWAKANGADLLSKDGLHTRLDDPKVVEALEFTKSLIDAQGGWSALRAARGTWDWFGRNPWVADQVGALPIESGPFWYVLARNSPDADVRGVPFTARNGKTITFLSGLGWAIPTRAKHPALACRWIKTMTSVKAWVAGARARAAIAHRDGYAFSPLPTANRSADERIHRELYESMSPRFDAAAKLRLKVQDEAFVIPPSPAAAEIQRALTEAVNRTLAGEQSPRQALEQAQREAQAAIAAAS